MDEEQNKTNSFSFVNMKKQNVSLYYYIHVGSYSKFNFQVMYSITAPTFEVLYLLFYDLHRKLKIKHRYILLACL